MAMRSGRERTFGRLVCGTVLIGVSASSVAFRPEGWANTPRRALLVLAPAWLVGASLCAWGWLRLSEEKKRHPDQTWPRFLHTELVAAAVVIAAMFGVLLMPEAWRVALMEAFHDLETALTVSRGGPP